ncbi:MAG: hypothetical protein HRU03_01165 [Nanoarchaeales archaeon]|nr:hypothetical protein [Nanoarchaeales archaeon]
MFIDYVLGGKYHTFKQVSKKDLLNLNFLLTNSKGDFLNLGISSNSCKYQGFNVCKSSTVEIFKFIENIMPVGVDVERVMYSGDKIERTFSSRFTEELTYIDDSSYESNSLDSSKSNSDNFFSKNKVLTKDSFIVGPTGGLIYEINNFEGDIVLDLDMKKKNDFNNNNRDYKTTFENGICYVEFTKQNGKYSYKQFMAIKTQNFAYDLVEKFVTKHYEFTRLQKSDWKWSVYRLMNIKVLSNKKIFFGCGFSLEEVKSQIELLEKYETDLKDILVGEVNDVFSNEFVFDKPLSSNVLTSYDLSVLATYKFLKVDLDNKNIGIGSFAGFPYFSNVWARDDIFGLRALINLGEIGLVKNRINYYLNLIDSKTGGLPNLLSRTGENNCDIVFLLSKRIEDFLFYLIEEDELNKLYSNEELKKIYSTLNKSFHNIVKYNWDFDNELIQVKNKNSFRDKLFEKFPLNVQVLFLNFTSSMSFLGKLIGDDINQNEIKSYEDFEGLLKMQIRSSYVKNGMLFSDIGCSKITYDIFSSYYFYPELFSKEEWEEIFDRGLIVLRTDWSGISSLSSEHKHYIDEHSGHDGESRTRGDSFFYMNNIAAICMNNLNENKYSKIISSILLTSTSDVLGCGTIGFSSELSSSYEKRSEGNLAQLTSSTSYIEMIDKLFDKIN